MYSAYDRYPIGDREWQSRERVRSDASPSKYSIDTQVVVTVGGQHCLQDCQDTLPDYVSMATRSNSAPRDLRATSSASLATTLMYEPSGSPISTSSAVQSAVSLISPANYEDDTAAQIHPLRYTGAGRFWKPPDERNSKHGRFRRMIKRSSKGGDDTVIIPQVPQIPQIPNLPSLNATGLGIDREPVSPRFNTHNSFNPYQSSSDRPSTIGSRHSYSAQSTLSASGPAVSLHSGPGSEPGDISSTDMLDQRNNSLTTRNLADERRFKMQEHLKKLQRDEEDRLRQLNMDDSQGSESPTPDLSRNTSDASSRPLSNDQAASKTPCQHLLLDDYEVTIFDEMQSPATDTSSHWEDLRELQDLNLTAQKSSSSLLLDTSRNQSSPEPPPYSIQPISELPDPRIELSPPPDNDSVFSDLDSIIGALRNKPRSSPDSSLRARAPTLDSTRNSGIVQRKLSPSTKPYPFEIELSAPGPAPPPPSNVFELSSSKSVIHRPETRRQAQRHRFNNDIKAYNTLPGEPFPILKQENSVELPAEENEVEKDEEVQYRGPRISIEPDFDPRTGKRWSLSNPTT